MMSTEKKLQAVTRWVIRKGLLNQFLLAQEQSDWIEGKERRNGVGEKDKVADSSNDK